MDLVTPSIGLVFWLTITFLILFFILRKVAWKQILSAVEERQKSIENDISQADIAKKQKAEIEQEKKALKQEAIQQRDELIASAKKSGEKIIEEAKEKAQAEADKIVADATLRIEAERNAALKSLKDQVAENALNIAERILEEELKDKEKQSSMISQMVDKVVFK